jgi:hypothetical protein
MENKTKLLFTILLVTLLGFNFTRDILAYKCVDGDPNCTDGEFDRKK